MDCDKFFAFDTRLSVELFSSSIVAACCCADAITISDASTFCLAISDSKILMNVALIAPFYVIAELLLMLALKPNVLDMLWLGILPAIFVLFTCVYGITINLMFLVFNWDNEVTVVKQSAAAMIVD